MTADHKAAYAHYLKLFTYSLSSEITMTGRAWLEKEIAEMERDTQANGWMKL